MDTVSALSQQWKERENKLFSQKAEVHVKEMKEITGTPKIDPLSKKIAEIVTRREMEMLGIQPTEVIVKKPTHIIPKPQVPPKESPSKVSHSKESPLKGTFSNHERKESGPKGDQVQPRKLTIKSGDLGKIEKTLHSKETAAHQNLEKIDINIDIIPPIHSAHSSNVINDQIVSVEEKKRSDDMLHNVEHLQAFQEELQREYPELGLNNSMEGSSFHTNELNELEEACKELGAEHHDNKSPILPTLDELDAEIKNKEVAIRETKNEGIENPEINGNDIEKIQDIDEETKEIAKNNINICDLGAISNKSEPSASANGNKYGNLKDINELSIDDKANSNENNILLNNKAEGSKSYNALPFKNKLDPNFTASKFQTNQSLQEGVTKEFANLQSSYIKASFLHSSQEKVPRTVPRCHINLTNFITSPIYYSVKSDPECRVKCKNGIGLVGSLRRELLENPVEESPEEINFYQKNIEWLKIRNEKINEFRNNTKEKDLEGCTFDPYFEKHEAQRKKQKNDAFQYKPLTTEEKVKAPVIFKPKIPENIIKYMSLSPADHKIRYQEGFSIEKFAQIAKPMVPYRSINFLN